MEMFKKEDLTHLIKNPQPPCVSIYLPTRGGGAGSLDDHNAFRSALVEVEQGLARSGAGRGVIESRRAALKALLDDPEFWAGTGQGIVAFAGEDGVKSWRLAAGFPHRVVVGSRFYILPLIPLVEQDQRFYLLAMSHHEVKLYQGDHSGMTRLRVTGFPDKNSEVMKTVNVRTAKPAPSATSHADAPYSGRGEATQDDIADLERFVRPIIQTLEGVLHKEKLPVVVAATERLAGALRKFGSSLPLVEGLVHGNPDRTSASELHARAWSLMRPAFDDERRRVERRYVKLDGTGRVTDALGEILRAADEGRVETLLLQDGAEQWGSVNAASWAVDVHAGEQPGDEGLLDRAAAATLGHHGQVWVLPKDEFAELHTAQAGVAAVYRY